MRTLVTILKREPQMPAWTRILAGPMVMRLLQNVHLELIAFHRDMQLQPAHADRVRADANYIVVSLRKCSRGGPLLPVGPRCNRWEQTDTHAGLRMPLCKYLQEFLSRLGVSGVNFHDSLDGRKLLPYQAAVLLDAWNRVRQILEQPLAEQRTAYRRLFGGSAAPDVRIVAEPRFATDVERDAPDDAMLTSGMSSAGHAGEGSVPVRGTFVHFSTGAQRQPRCGSTPPGERTAVMVC